MSGVPSGGNVWKNIAIGIFTTVAAYAIINFIGIGKKDNTKKIRKEATVKAWQSVSDYINYADQKFKTIACYSCDVQEMKKEMLRELENYSAKVTNIKEDKNVDDKMLGIVDIIRQRFLDFKTPIGNFYDSIIALKQRPLDEQVVAMPRVQQNLNDEIAKIVNRDSSEFKNFLSDVNKTYKLGLRQIPLPGEYDSTAIVGKWKIECVFDLELKSDGSLLWQEAGTDFPGKWKLENKRLSIYLDNGQELLFPVRQLNRKFMLITNQTPNGDVEWGGCPQ
jgi:hypothetical protein